VKGTQWSGAIECRAPTVAAVAAKVASGGKIDGAALEREQHAAHGLAWIATYVEALRQLASYARRLDGEGRFGEMESLLAHFERKERGRLRVRRVDVDANPEIAERFRVSVVPTLVLVKDKRAVSRLDGRTSAPKIEAMLEPHLRELAAA